MNTIVKCGTCGKPFKAYRSQERQFCSVPCTPFASFGKTHGQSNTRLYRIWASMISRCHSPTTTAFSRYGARGISVCAEWRKSFSTFASWSKANGYSDELQIDRIDPSAHYCPHNCRWATRVQQLRNCRKRTNAKTSKFKGVSKHSDGKWVAQSHSNGKTLYLGLFAREIDAARAYDAYARENYGDFARCNFSSEKANA